MTEKPMSTNRVNPDSYKPHRVPQALKVITGSKHTVRESGDLSGQSESTVVRITDKCRVNLPVGPELKTAADWYVDVFQLPGYIQENDDLVVLRLHSGSQNIVLWKTKQQTDGLCMLFNGKQQPLVTLNVKDVDGIHERIVARGGESVMAPCDRFFRTAIFKDPYGNGLGILQEPPGWSQQIGRSGEAATLDWVKIPVPGSTENLLKTAEWYCTYLGLQAGALTEEKDGMDLQPGNLHLQLTDTSRPALFIVGEQTVPVLILETFNVEVMHKKLTDTGASVGTIENGTLGRSFTLLDPNGNAVGITQS